MGWRNQSAAIRTFCSFAKRGLAFSILVLVNFSIDIENLFSLSQHFLYEAEERVHLVLRYAADEREDARQELRLAAAEAAGP